MKRWPVFCGSIAVTLLLAAPPARLQTTTAPAAQGQAPAKAPAPAKTETTAKPAPATDTISTAKSAPDGKSNGSATFKPEELEQIVAPIALYPDALLAQVFMASTYPLEIVEAARWSKANPGVKGEAVPEAVKDQTWDSSVKSLVAFPDVLTMMNEKIDWTQKLGDAFLAQQKDVMQAVQRLRTKAKDAGHLNSSKEQTVKTEPAPAGVTPTQTIIIESANPQVIYVPSYNPTVVYGAWAYPAYPPYAYYPPYYAGGMFFSFSMGMWAGAAWGNCNWGGSDIDIDIDRQNNFNRNEINPNRDGTRGDRGSGTGDRNTVGNTAGNTSRGSGNRESWNHDPSHRKGVGYRDSATQQKYNRGADAQNVAAREQYRGRAEQGRDQMQREGISNQRDLAGNQIGTRDNPGSRDAGSAMDSRDFGGERGMADSNRDFGGGDRGMGDSNRDFGGADSNRDMGGTGSNRDFEGTSRGTGSRDTGGSRSNDAFGGGGGSSARSYSNRGGMSRGGGGMSRGGGGRRR